MKIIALTNKNFVGDNNQVQGILSAYVARSQIKVDSQTMDETALDMAALTPETIVLTAGDHGLEIASQIKAETPAVLVVWSGHQFFEAFSHLEHWPDRVCLPKTAVTDTQMAFLQEKTQLTLTDGVAHCVNAQTVADDFAKYPSLQKIDETFTSFVGIVLAGDAPTANGEMRFFDPADAIKQAQHIAAYIKSLPKWHDKATILVTNGPRTGKHNPATGAVYDPDPHRTSETDSTSVAFFKELYKLLTNEPVFFFDFQFAELAFRPSAYKPIMHVIAQHAQQSAWFVPCESTSMVTESTFLAEKGVPVFVYHPSSENETHLRHAADYVQSGIVSDINAMYQPSGPARRVVSAANQIAALLPRSALNLNKLGFLAASSTTDETSKLNLLLLSGSKAAAGLPPGTEPGYLDFAEDWIKKHFAKAIGENKPILFVPYACPGGDTEAGYFEFVRDRMVKMGITLTCAPAEGITAETLDRVGGIFVGGGHTYTLLHKLQQTGSLEVIRQHVLEGLPYLGSSAGSIIACPTIKTTNDMPGPANDVIDLRSFGFIPLQLNCHYMDPSMHDPLHQGETRDTRLKEVSTFNPSMPILGLYEGTAIQVIGKTITILNSQNARGLNPPLFLNSERQEIPCQVETPLDITHLLEPEKPVCSSSNAFNP